VGDSGDASSAAANPAAAGGKGEAVPAKDDDAPAAGLLPPVSSEEAANSTQESGEKAITQPPTANLLLVLVYTHSSKINALLALLFVCLFPSLGKEGEMQDFNELLCSWSGVLEDEELQVQDAVANPSKRSNDSSSAAATTTSSSNGSSPSVVHSDPAILPAPAQQIPPAMQDVKTLAEHHVPAVPEVKQAGILPDSSLLLW